MLVRHISLLFIYFCYFVIFNINLVIIWFDYIYVFLLYFVMLPFLKDYISQFLEYNSDTNNSIWTKKFCLIIKVKYLPRSKLLHFISKKFWVETGLFDPRIISQKLLYYCCYYCGSFYWYFSVKIQETITNCV